MKSESPGVGPKQQHLKSFYLFIFGCAASSLPLGHFSSCGEWGLLSSCGAWISHGGGFSRCGSGLSGAWASVVAAHRLIHCSSLAAEHRLSSCGARA